MHYRNAFITCMISVCICLIVLTVSSYVPWYIQSRCPPSWLLQTMDWHSSTYWRNNTLLLVSRAPSTTLIISMPTRYAYMHVCIYAPFCYHLCLTSASPLSDYQFVSIVYCNSNCSIEGINGYEQGIGIWCPCVSLIDCFVCVWISETWAIAMTAGVTLYCVRIWKLLLKWINIELLHWSLYGVHVDVFRIVTAYIHK